MTDYGKFSEVNIFCVECRSISPSREHGQEKYQRTPVKKNKKEHKVSDNKSPLSKKFWSKSKECGYRFPDNWESFEEEFRRKGKLCEWTCERVQRAYDKVTMKDIGHSSIAQEIFRKSTNFLRRIIAEVLYGRRDLVLRLPAL